MFNNSEVKRDAGKESPSTLKSSPWMKVPQIKRFSASNVFHIEVTYISIYICMYIYNLAHLSLRS